MHVYLYSKNISLEHWNTLWEVKEGQGQIILMLI